MSGMHTSSSAPTPIRAITTPLRSSAAPPIPPASVLYAPLAQGVLHRRLTGRILPWSYAVALAGTVFALFWAEGPSEKNSGGKYTLARVLGASAGMWAGGVLPVVLLRKAYLTVTHTTAPSPLLLLKKSFAPPLRARTLHALQAHVLSALFVLGLHVAILDPGVPVFIRSRKHPYTPHPIFVLLALTQALLAGLYVLRALLRDVWVFPFRPHTPTPHPAAVLAPALLALLAPLGALVVLFVFLPVARWVPFVSPLLRPLLTPRLSALRALPRAVHLAAGTAWAWEAAGGVWGWGVGEPLHTTPSMRALVSGISVALTPAPTPSASVASSVFSTPARGGSSSSFFRPSPSAAASSSAPAPTTTAPPPPPTIYTHLAYAELLHLAAAPASDAVALKARAEAFDVEGAVWGRLVREALILLGREYAVLVGRGAPVAPSPPVSASAAASPSAFAGLGAGSTPTASPSPSVPVPTLTPLKKNIFAPKTPASPGARVGAAIEGLIAATASPAPPPPPAHAHAHAPPKHEQLQKHTPEVKWQLRPLLEAVRPMVPALPVPGWVKVALESAGEVLEAVGRAGLPAAWTRRRKGREAAGWVPRREVCVEVVGVLTHLTCASLTEDRFGVVQRDIPRILEALLAFLAEVEAAQAALRPKPAEMPEAEKEVLAFLGEVEKAVEGEQGQKKAEERARQKEREREEAMHLEEARTVLGEVGDALKDGVARIARTFGDKLRAFRFPPRTAARLQGFLEYA